VTCTWILSSYCQIRGFVFRSALEKAVKPQLPLQMMGVLGAITVFCMLSLASCIVLPLHRHTVVVDQQHTRDEAQLLTGNTNTVHLFVASVLIDDQWFQLQIDTGSAGTHVPLIGCTEENGATCKGRNGLLNPKTKSCSPCTASCGLAGHCGHYSMFGNADTPCCGTHLSYGDGSFVRFVVGKRRCDVICFLQNALAVVL
jgi:hypothetical protein